MRKYKRKYVAREPVFGWDHYNKLKKQKAESTVDRRQFVYLIKSDSGLFKIGISTNPRHRLSSIISSSGFSGQLIAFYKTIEPASVVEKKLHKLFSAYRVRGEWFDFPDTYTLDKFETICERYGMTPQGFTVEDGRIFYDYEKADELKEKEQRESLLAWVDKMNKEWETGKKTNYD